MRDRPRVLVRWLAWVAGLGLLVLVIRRIGWHAVTDALAHVGPGILWLAVAYTLGNAAIGLPWRFLFPKALRPTAAAAITSRFAAAGLNALLPLVALGEVSRLLWLRRSDWPDGVAAILADRLLFLLGSAAGVAAGATALFLLPGAHRDLGIWAGLAALIIVLAVAATSAIILRRAPVAWVRRGLARLRLAVTRLPGNAADDAELAPDRIDLALRALLRRPRRRLAGALGLHLLGRALLTVEIYVACLLLRLEVGLAQVLVLAAVPLVLGAVAPIVPSQIGVQEGAQSLVAAAIGLPPWAGLLVVLLQRGRQVLFLPVTALLLSLRPHRAPSAPAGHQAPHLPS